MEWEEKRQKFSSGFPHLTRKITPKPFKMVSFNPSWGQSLAACGPLGVWRQIRSSGTRWLPWCCPRTSQVALCALSTSVSDLIWWCFCQSLGRWNHFPVFSVRKQAPGCEVTCPGSLTQNPTCAFSKYASEAPWQ